MPCYSPLLACRMGGGEISFKKLPPGWYGKTMSLPCGKCIGCRLERARQWAVRLMHETQCHESSSFITLTYDPEFLPSSGSISPRVAQLFIKRLRKKIKTKIRFFLCGEYGEKFGRPHYHALIFGYDFPDKVLYKTQANGSQLYSSKLLEEVWGFGFCSIGQVTFDSANYVARYATKKIYGPSAADHYQGRTAEFITMSRKPGIGSEWIKKFSSDVYPSDEVITNGYPSRPPRFYDQYLESSNPDLYEKLKAERTTKAEELDEEVNMRFGSKRQFFGNVRPSFDLDRQKSRRIFAEAKASQKQRQMEKE